MTERAMWHITPDGFFVTCWRGQYDEPCDECEAESLKPHAPEPDELTDLFRPDDDLPPLVADARLTATVRDGTLSPLEWD